MPVAPDQQGRVSRFVRLLAWIFICLAMLGTISWLWLVSAGKNLSLGWVEILLGLIGLALIVPLVFSIAIKGHPPRWWYSVEDAIDVRKALEKFTRKSSRHQR